MTDREFELSELGITMILIQNREPLDSACANEAYLLLEQRALMEEMESVSE